MALRWFLHFANAQISGHPSEGISGHPSEGKTKENHNSGQVKERKVKCTQIVGYPNEENAKGVTIKGHEDPNGRLSHKEKCPKGFQMPLHYPRYKKEDYEKMEEWKVDMVLREYGLSFEGSYDEKRAYAIGVFLWPDQL